MEDSNGWPITFTSMTDAEVENWYVDRVRDHHIASRDPKRTGEELIALCDIILRAVGELDRRKMWNNLDLYMGQVVKWNNLKKTYEREAEEMQQEDSIDTTLALQVRDKINEVLIKNYPDADDQLVTVQDPANVQVSLDLDNPNHPDMAVFGIIRNALNDCKAYRSVTVGVFIRTVTTSHFTVGGS